MCNIRVCYCRAGLTDGTGKAKPHDGRLYILSFGEKLQHIERALRTVLDVASMVWRKHRQEGRSISKGRK
jgi:hypothetical protein